MSEPTSFVYTNHEGRVEVRVVDTPILWYGVTQWYPEECWLLHGWDHRAQDWRDFQLSRCDFTLDTLKLSNLDEVRHDDSDDD